MALLEGGFLPNALLGLASLKRPGLLGQVQQQQRYQSEQERQAEEDRRHRAMEDLKMKQIQTQMGGMQRAQSLLSGDYYPGVSLPQDQLNRQLGGALLQGGQTQAAMGLLQPKPQEGFTLGQNQIRYNAQGVPIAMGPASGGVDQLELNKMQFAQEDKLRTTFNKETQPFVEVNNAYGRISSSAEDPSPAGDMALIFNFMKMLDPGSTVREGEYANAQNAGSVPSRITALYNSVVNGTRLDATQRKDFVNRAKYLYSQAATNYDQRANIYKELAKSYGLTPSKVVIGRKLFKDVKPEPPAPPGTVKRVIR